MGGRAVPLLADDLRPRYDVGVATHPNQPDEHPIRSAPPGAPLAVLTAAALADGLSVVSGIIFDDDVRALLDGLSQLGVPLRRDDAVGRVRMTGCGGHWRTGEADIVCARPAVLWHLLPACCTGHGRYRIVLPAGLEAGVWRRSGAGPGGYRRPRRGGSARRRRDLERRVGRTRRGRGSHYGCRRLAGRFRAVPAVRPQRCAGGRIRRRRTGAGPRPETLAVMEAFGVSCVTGPGGRMIVPAPQRYRGQSIDLGHIGTNP